MLPPCDVADALGRDDASDPVSGAQREREILRQASVALSGRVVTMWEVSPDRELVARVSSVPHPPYHATVLDVENTLLRWNRPLAVGGRWVACRMTETDWCVAPVRREPAAPPPGGIERRSRERITLELAGLCVGIATTSGPRVLRASSLEEAGPVPGSVNLADPVTLARAALKASVERIEADGQLDAGLRSALLDELAAVAGGLDLSQRRALSLEARLHGIAGSLRFDPAEIVQACVVLERPASRARGVVLHREGSAAGDPVFGDPYALSCVLRTLIRCAVARARSDAPPIVVRIEQSADTVRLSVEEGAAPDPTRVGTVDDASAGRRDTPDFPLLRRMIQDACGGRIDLHPLPHGGRAATILAPCGMRALVGAPSVVGN